MIYKDIEEDYPKCKVELVSSCHTNTNNKATSLVEPMKKCRKVEVMRCQIATRKVRRGQQQSLCSRVPSLLCARKMCPTKQLKCYPAVKMVRQLRPEEFCHLTQRIVCQMAGGDGCRTRGRRICRTADKSSGNSEYSLP